MKPNLIKIYSLYCCISIICSCSKLDEFGDLNQNPAGTTTPIPSALLTNTLSFMGNDVWDAWSTASGGLTTVCGMYCQYYSETLYTELSTYAKPNINWDAYYTGRLYDLQIIINYNSDPATAAKAATYGSNNNQVAIARILKVYLFSLLTDCYGDMPYFNALTANNGINPFDKQEDIYKHFFSELTEAVNQFDEGNAPLGDILFNGNITRWKQFANSLHALLALNISKAGEALGKAEFNAALSAEEGVFETGENAQLQYPGTNYYNPVYNYYYVDHESRLGVSNTMTDWLTSHHDQRITAFGSSTTGFPYGLVKDTAVAWGNTHTGWARILQGAATPGNGAIPIITSAEIYLARAEAAQRGWTNEDAAVLYRQGLQESWHYWNVYTETDFNNYMEQSSIALNSDADNLQKICEQQWAAHYPNGPRGFSSWRRTGYPLLLPAIGSPASSIPRRFPYGSNTYGTNPDNANAAAVRYNINGEDDSMWGRVWWDGE